MNWNFLILIDFCWVHLDIEASLGKVSYCVAMLAASLGKVKIKLCWIQLLVWEDPN